MYYLGPLTCTTVGGGCIVLSYSAGSLFLENLYVNGAGKPSYVPVSAITALHRLVSRFVFVASTNVVAESTEWT